MPFRNSSSNAFQTVKLIQYKIVQFVLFLCVIVFYEGTSLFLHWLVGMVFVFYFASFVILIREVSVRGIVPH